MFVKIFITTLLFLIPFNVFALEQCKWDNRKGVPCLTISKTSNTSAYNNNSVIKKVFNKQEIGASGAKDTFDLLKLIPGLDYYQSGQKGQTGAIFMRGSESNHTLVLLNGIPINDQSTTNVYMILDKILFKLFNKLRCTKVRTDLILVPMR